MASSAIVAHIPDVLHTRAASLSMYHYTTQSKPVTNGWFKGCGQTPARWGTPISKRRTRSPYRYHWRTHMLSVHICTWAPPRLQRCERGTIPEDEDIGLKRATTGRKALLGPLTQGLEGSASVPRPRSRKHAGRQKPERQNSEKNCIQRWLPTSHT